MSRRKTGAQAQQAQDRRKQSSGLPRDLLMQRPSDASVESLRSFAKLVTVWVTIRPLDSFSKCGLRN